MELIHSSIIVTSKEFFFVQPKQLNVRAKLNMSGHTDQPILNFIFSSDTLFAVGSTDGRSAIEVELELDGHRICMEIDTGASLSLVSEATFKRLWPGRSLQPSTVRLKTYTSVAGVGIGTSSCERRQGTSS